MKLKLILSLTLFSLLSSCGGNTSSSCQKEIMKFQKQADITSFIFETQVPCITINNFTVNSCSNNIYTIIEYEGDVTTERIYLNGELVGGKRMNLDNVNLCSVGKEMECSLIDSKRYCNG